jgi:hypothetical protein
MFSSNLILKRLIVTVGSLAFMSVCVWYLRSAAQTGDYHSIIFFLAALAAVYLTVGAAWVGQRHRRALRPYLLSEAPATGRCSVGQLQLPQVHGSWAMPGVKLCLANDGVVVAPALAPLLVAMPYAKFRWSDIASATPARGAGLYVPNAFALELQNGTKVVFTPRYSSSGPTLLDLISTRLDQSIGSGH